MGQNGYGAKTAITTTKTVSTSSSRQKANKPPNIPFLLSESKSHKYHFILRRPSIGGDSVYSALFSPLLPPNPPPLASIAPFKQTTRHTTGMRPVSARPKNRTGVSSETRRWGRVRTPSSVPSRSRFPRRKGVKETRTRPSPPSRFAFATRRLTPGASRPGTRPSSRGFPPRALPCTHPSRPAGSSKRPLVSPVPESRPPARPKKRQEIWTQQGTRRRDGLHLPAR